MRIGEWWSLDCEGEERFGFQQLNLTNSANVNSINAGYYFLLFLSAVYRLIRPLAPRVFIAAATSVDERDWGEDGVVPAKI